MTPDLAAFVGDAEKVKAFLDDERKWTGPCDEFTSDHHKHAAGLDLEYCENCTHRVYLALLADREAKLAAAEQERRTLLHELDVAVTKIEAAEAKLRAVEELVSKHVGDLLSRGRDGVLHEAPRHPHRGRTKGAAP